VASTDMLEVVNGPEDGIQFPITRSPVVVGTDPNCAVHLQVDPDIGSQHARVTVVSKGYRIRQLSAGPPSVNGKRVGRFHSRTLRSGEVLRIGNTDLMLQCAPDGLASRSVGVPMESDAAYALGALLGKLALAPRLAWRVVRGGGRNIFGWIVAAAGVSILLRIFAPTMFDTVWAVIQAGINCGRGLLSQGGVD